MVERITDSVMRERETVIMMISVLVTSDVVTTTVFISQVDSGIILMTVVRSAAPLIDPVPRVRVCAQVMMSVRQLVTTTTV